ncbi:MAG: PIG-L family deacetylase [Kiritimatiellae bacterium]|nr:PIG-L family deacetylase [Kiritimatiellia bacterium]
MKDRAECPLQGSILVAVPHMDDGVLGCGGTLALLADKRDVHFLYVGDGGGSDGRLLPTSRGAAPADIGATRRAEAQAALAVLGVPDSNVAFLGIPDGTLSSESTRIRAELERRLAALAPDHLLIPFRLDWHPDHIALSGICRRTAAAVRSGMSVLEYFVYVRRRLLPGGDIRRLLRKAALLSVDISEASSLKRQAIRCFVSQTTLFYPRQARPVLSPALVDTAAAGPEVFFRSRAGASDAVSAVPEFLLRLETSIERAAKRTKQRLRSVLAGRTRSAGRTPL